METKRCNTCGEDKPLDEFHKDKHSSDGKTRNCKPCNNAKSLAYHHSDHEAAAERNRRQVAKNPDGPAKRKRRERERDPELAASKRMLWRFQLDLEGYQAWLSSKGGVCFICATDNPGTRGGVFFAVDHDRDCCKTNRSCGMCVRGIVCHRCNTYVLPVYEGKRNGQIDDLYESVAQYVREYKERRALVEFLTGW